MDNQTNNKSSIIRSGRRVHSQSKSIVDGDFQQAPFFSRQRKDSFILQDFLNQNKTNGRFGNQKVHTGQKLQTQQTIQLKQKRFQTQLSSQKQVLLYKLQSSNEKLKQQIYDVQKFQKQRMKRMMQPRKQNIDDTFFASSTNESLLKELQSVRLKVKQYENQIKQLKKMNTVSKVKKIQQLRAKAQKTQKTKNLKQISLQKIKKDVKKLQEKLQYVKNTSKGEQTKTVLKQIEHLQQKIKEMAFTQNKRNNYFQKQSLHISQIENKMLKKNISQKFIEDLQRKILHSERESPQKNTSPIKKQKTTTVESYQKTQTEIVLFQKIIKQQTKYEQQLRAQLKEIEEKNKMIQCNSKKLDEEINLLEIQIEQIRKNINPKKMKPKPLPEKELTIQDHKKNQKEHLKEVRRKFFERKTQKYLKAIESPNKNQFRLQTKEEYILQNSDFTMRPEIQQSNIEPSFSVDAQQQKIVEKSIEESVQQIATGRTEKMLITMIEQPENLQNFVFQEQIWGKEKQSNTYFSDQNVCQFQIKKQNCKITGIKIVFSKEHNIIIGIKFSYNNIYSQKFHCANQSCLNQNQLKVFTCLQGEWIVCINCKINNEGYLNQIIVKTNLNEQHTLSKQKWVINQEIYTKQGFIPQFIFGNYDQIGICRIGVKYFQQIS